MKIKLLNATISGFQNIAENQQVFFLEPGLYSVVGQNLDDGGSNASGKSSFVRAITAGILGNKAVSVSNKEAVNRILNVPPEIKIELEVNGKLVNITRVIGGKFTVLVDGVELVGKNDEIQEKLLQILNINEEHFLHLTHKMQGQFGGFLLMKDKDKKDFLSSFFDITKIEEAEEKNAEDIRELSNQLTIESEKLKILVAQNDLLNNEIKTLENKIKEYTSTEFLSKLSSKKSELTHKEIELKELESVNLKEFLLTQENYKNLLNRKNELTAQIANIEIEYNQSVNELKSQAELIQNELNKEVVIPDELAKSLSEIDFQLKNSIATDKKILELATKKQNLEKELLNNKKKVESLKPDTCIMCGQPIGLETHNKIKNQFEAEISLILSKLDEIDKQKQELEKNTKNVSELQLAKESILQQIAVYKNSKDQTVLKQKLNQIKEQITLKTQYFNQIRNELIQTEKMIKDLENMAESNFKSNIAKFKAEIVALKKELEVLEKTVEDAKNTLFSVQKKHETQSKNIAEIENKISFITQKLTIKNKLAQVLSKNGFIGHIFDGILEDLNRLANENIKLIPVISRLNIQFTSDKAVKSTGAINKSITYKILDKDDEVSFESLSGSEKESLMLAVDVALDSILSSRLGVDINYKILDEQFGWVDNENKENLLEFLKQKYKDKVILIIDHGSEINASIDKKIIVQKNNGVATILCQTFI